MSWNLFTQLLAILAVTFSLVISVLTAKVARRAERRIVIYQAVLRAAGIQPPPEPPPIRHRPAGGHLRRVAVIGALTGAATWLASRINAHRYAAGGLALAAATVTGVVLLPAPSRSGSPELLPLPATSVPHRPVPTGAGQSISRPALTTTLPTGGSPDPPIVPVIGTIALSLPGMPTKVIPTLPPPPSLPSLTTPTLPTETIPGTGSPPADVARGLCIVLALQEEPSACLLG